MYVSVQAYTVKTVQWVNTPAETKQLCSNTKDLSTSHYYLSITTTFAVGNSFGIGMRV